MDNNHYIQKIINLAQYNSVKKFSLKQCDIIIPVYNGFKALKKCIASLLIHTENNHNIYLYNDASTDTNIVPWINSIVLKHKHIFAVQQPKNGGYLKNVNQAMLDTRNDVVLLNSDTVVTENWLEELSIIANDPNVAIVCPLSDNATY